MKNKLILKVIIVVFVTFLAFSMFNNISLATGSNFDFENFENQTASEELMSPVKTVMGGIIAVMRIVFTAIAFIIIMYMGIKYISSAPGERAELKKSAVQYVIGAIILFGAAGILTVLQDVIIRVVG